MWLESIDKGNVIPSPLNLVYYSLLLLRVMINVILMIPRIICCCLCRCNCKKARIILRLQNVLVNTRIYASCCFSAMTGGLWFPSLPVKVISYTYSDLVTPIPHTRMCTPSWKTHGLHTEASKSLISEMLRVIHVKRCCCFCHHCDENCKDMQFRVQF